MTTATLEEFQLVPLAQLVPGPDTRRHVDRKAFDDLVASVRQHGVLEPLLVRPHNGQLEVVAGRRRLAAAKAAKVDQVPVRVKTLSDEEALEIAVVENLQREDVHPLDEAEGYQALLKRAGYDVERLAARVGKSPSHIYQRLRLRELVPQAREAFERDELATAHALQLARLQPQDQTKALGWLLQYAPTIDGRRQPRMTAEELRERIKSDLLRSLAAAPWKLDDATLVPKAGPCTTCPKRVGNVSALFPDITNGQTCADAACFALKRAGFLARQEKALGRDVIRVEGEWTNKTRKGVLQRHEWNPAKAADKGARRALVVSGAEAGKIVHVTLHRDRAREERATDSYREELRRRQAQETARYAERQQVRHALLTATLRKVRAPLKPAELRALLEECVSSQWFLMDADESARQVIFQAVFGSAPGTTKPVDRQIGERLGRATPHELVRLLLGLACGEALEYREPKLLTTLVSLHRINRKTVERTVRAEIAARQKAAAATRKNRGRTAAPAEATA